MLAVKYQYIWRWIMRVSDDRSGTVSYRRRNSFTPLVVAPVPISFRSDLYGKNKLWKQKKINKSPTGRNARSRCKLYRVRRIYLFYRTVFPHGLRRAFSTSIRRRSNLTPNPEVFDETVVDSGSFAFENRIFSVNGGGEGGHTNPRTC